MTREDAKELNTHKSSKMQVERWNEAVDKIYDDFDVDIKLAQKIIEEHGNRTCENCKFYEKEISYSNAMVGKCNSIESCTPTYTKQYFGCVAWESKND